MSDQVISPDGKWMWTGSEWIPAPPQGGETITPENVKTESNSPTNTISDTVIMGDYTIQQTIQQTSDIENYMKTMVDAYKDLREDRALEIYELAKKIDYDNATLLYNGKYRREISTYRCAIIMKKLDSMREKEADLEFEDRHEQYKYRLKESKSLFTTAEKLYEFDVKSELVAELFYEMWKYIPNYFTGKRYDNPRWLADQFFECGNIKRSQKIIDEIEMQDKNSFDDPVSYRRIVIGIISGLLVFYLLIFLLAFQS